MKIQLLYWGRAWGTVSHSAKKKFECHAYCQLEVCVRGKLVIHTPGQKFVLHTGDMLFIPPGMGHQVFYPDSNNEFYSLKFECSNPPGITFSANSKFNLWSINSLRLCHDIHARIAMPIDPDTREIVEGLLLLMMQRFTCKALTKTPTAPEIFKKIREVTLRGGSSINVSDCAQALNMNAAQLNYLFSKGLKEFGLSKQEYSIKKLIDQTLIHQIDRYLEFTDFSLEAIALQMKFNNVYTFSRYYKRLTGFPPSEKRKKKNVVAATEQ